MGCGCKKQGIVAKPRVKTTNTTTNKPTVRVTKN
jgi:hypothetical protein